MENSKVALTTTDNDYDPFTQFTLWLLRDNELGYNTCGYLANVAKLSDDMTDKEVEEEIERAIDEIIEFNPLGIYVKVFNKSIE